ncbi:MAG: polysaccharide biosynthesis protein [Sphingobacterium sp.]|nr:polysaccharide biosynthesis protein [Sphingobacterium sp.]
MNFKNIIRNNSKIINNFVSLVILNVVNYVFPLIIIPILIKRLGLEVYGKYIFAFTILNYLNLIVQYGFNFSATNKVAKNQENKSLISGVYTSVTLIRICFSIIITIGLLLSGFFIRDQFLMYIMGIGIFFGQGLIPVWLFQGLEQMKYITIVNALVRLLAFVLIVLMVQAPSDVNFLMFIQTLSFVLGGIASLFLVKYQLNINFTSPNIKSIRENLIEGWSLFLSTIGMNLYRESNVVILGIVAGYSTVGLYSPAEKLIKGIQSFTNIIVTALYPHFSKKMNGNESQGYVSFQKIGKLLTIIFFFGTILMIILSPYIINAYIGKGYTSTIIDFKVLSLVILFGGLNYYYGIVGLVNFNKESLFNRLVWISGVVGISASFILSYLLKDIGAAVAMAIAEIVLLGLIIRCLKK